VSQALYREFVLDTPAIGAVLVHFLKSNAAAFVDKGTPLRVIVTEEEMDRLDVQIAYYFGPLIKQICAQAWVKGRQHSKEVWHEHFAKLFLPSKELIMPDGETVVKRGSIARGHISLKKMNVFLLEVEAYAAQELGVILEDSRGLAV
jgi:hypothetical protein